MDLTAGEKFRVHIAVLALAMSHQLVRVFESILLWLMEKRLQLRIKARSKLTYFSFSTNPVRTIWLRDALCRAILGEFSTYFSMITRRGVDRQSLSHTLSGAAPWSGKVVEMSRRQPPETIMETTSKTSRAPDRYGNAHRVTSHSFSNDFRDAPLSPSEKNQHRRWLDALSESETTVVPYSSRERSKTVKSAMEPEE